MLFNSFAFAVFFTIVFVLYWFVTRTNMRLQNLMLLVASYFFYACWDWRFLFLLIFSTFLDYFTGLKMARTDSLHLRRFWFWLSIIVNVGFLAIFKYYNFFASSFIAFLSGFGLNVHVATLQVILPVGISFYTFHGLSYVIDIYNRRINAEKDYVDYSLFVSFFPLLVAGPIERATHLLPQLKKARKFDYANTVDALRQILWGLVKKVVIADGCATFANEIFESSSDYSGSTLVLGALFFSFQIYGDFSGYSDIALGTARLLGIELMNNFSFPYFSRDIAEFWRRWHISLSSWFKDYVYIPMGGSKVGTWKKIRNTFIIFLLSGFWHGANWTYVVWGLLNALFIMPSILFGTNRSNLDVVAQYRLLPDTRELSAMSLTFSATVFSWIFFRAKDLDSAFAYISGIFNRTLFSLPEIRPTNMLLLIFIFLIVEWNSRSGRHGLEFRHRLFIRPVRFLIYLICIYSILFSYRFHEESEFIYFQF